MDPRLRGDDCPNYIASSPASWRQTPGMNFQSPPLRGTKPEFSGLLRASQWRSEQRSYKLWSSLGEQHNSEPSITLTRYRLYDLWVMIWPWEIHTNLFIYVYLQLSFYHHCGHYVVDRIDNLQMTNNAHILRVPRTLADAWLGLRASNTRDPSRDSVEGTDLSVLPPG